MLHISREFANEADLALELVQRATAHGRSLCDPDHPQQLYDFPGGSVLIIHGNLTRGRGGRFGMEGPVDATVIDDVEELLRSTGVPGRFILNPYADPSLANELGRRGYYVHHWLQVLVRELDQVDPVPKLDPDTRIERIDQTNSELWANVMCDGFRSLGYDYLVDPVFHLPMAYTKDSICYIARNGDQPVAAANLVMANGWAVLFTSSTLPEFRNRGIQNAFIRRRLADGQAAGCRYAMILTDPGSGSQRNAERAGFQVAYSLPTMQRDWE